MTVSHEITVKIGDMPEVRAALETVQTRRAAILSEVDKIVCDYQCGNGTRPDGSFGWVCGCGNADVAATIRTLLGDDDGDA